MFSGIIIIYIYIYIYIYILSGIVYIYNIYIYIYIYIYCLYRISVKKGKEMWVLSMPFITKGEEKKEVI